MASGQRHWEEARKDCPLEPAEKAIPTRGSGVSGTMNKHMTQHDDILVIAFCCSALRKHVHQRGIEQLVTPFLRLKLPFPSESSKVAQPLKLLVATAPSV